MGSDKDDPAASEGDSGARGGYDPISRVSSLTGRVERRSFSGDFSTGVSGGGGSTAGDLNGENGGTTSGGEEEVHHPSSAAEEYTRAGNSQYTRYSDHPSHSGAGGSGIHGGEATDDDVGGGTHETNENRSLDSSPSRNPRHHTRWDHHSSRGGSWGGTGQGRAQHDNRSRMGKQSPHPTGSFSGVISGVTGGGSGGHGITVSSGFGGHEVHHRGHGGAYSSRGHGSNSSSHKLHKSVRFATTIDDGGQRTGSRGRYSPPPSPPRHVAGHRNPREQREDTPPGNITGRNAREDTPPAPGNSVDSGGGSGDPGAISMQEGIDVGNAEAFISDPMDVGAVGLVDPTKSVSQSVLGKRRETDDRD